MNLAVTYAMMNREQFTERFASLFEQYQMDEEKLMQLSNAIMDEIANWRDRKNMASMMKDATEGNSEALKEQLAALTEEIRKLNDQLNKKGDD